jgi:hypothetical protein
VGYSFLVLWTIYGEHTLGRVSGRCHCRAVSRLPEGLVTTCLNFPVREPAVHTDFARTPFGRHASVR